MSSRKRCGRPVGLAALRAGLFQTNDVAIPSSSLR
jgi:hypothetical protein